MVTSPTGVQIDNNLPDIFERFILRQFRAELFKPKDKIALKLMGFRSCCNIKGVIIPE